MTLSNNGPKSLRHFTIRLLLVAPVMVGLWWFVAVNPILDLVLWFTDHLARLIYDNQIIGITEITAPEKVGKPALLWSVDTARGFQDHPLIAISYTFNPIRFMIGLPLLWSLLIASADRHWFGHFVASNVIYLPVISLAILLFIQSKFGARPYFDPTGESPYVLISSHASIIYYLNFIGGKLGQFVLPPVIPVLIWALKNPALIYQLAKYAPQSTNKPPTTSRIRPWLLSVCVLILLLLIATLLKNDEQISKYRLGKQALLDREFDTAYKYLSPLAEFENYAPAQFDLGIIHEIGLGIRPSPQKALTLYTRAAKQGSLSAQYYLARMYFMGIGIDSSKESAYYWFEKLAAQGYVPAQHQVGMMLQLGVGAKKNVAEAKEWLNQATRNGFTLVPK